MKTRNLLIAIFALLMVIMPSCKPIQLINGGEVSSKDYDTYKTKYPKRTAIQFFNSSIDDFARMRTADPSLTIDSFFINDVVYATSYDFYKQRMIKQLGIYIRKTDRGNQFLKIIPVYWKEMPITSASYSKNFDDYVTACVEEYRKATLAGTTHMVMSVITSDAFMFKYINAVVVDSKNEFCDKMKKPVAKPKRGADVLVPSTSTSSSSKSLKGVK